MKPRKRANRSNSHQGSLTSHSDTRIGASDYYIEDEDPVSDVIRRADNKRKREAVESNLFLLGAIGSNQAKPILYDRLFPSKDACDEKEAVLMQHCLSSALASTRYTIAHHHPRILERAPVASSSPSDHNDSGNNRSNIYGTTIPQPSGKKKRSHDGIRTLGQSYPNKRANGNTGTLHNTPQPSDDHATIDANINWKAVDEESNLKYCEELDFIETLLYDCRRGKMVEEFQKIIEYLTNEYFRPVNPTNVMTSSFLLAQASERRQQQRGTSIGGRLPDEEEPHDNNSSTIPEARKERLRTRYDAVMMNQGEKNHRMYEDSKRVRTDVVLETLQMISDKVKFVERESKEALDAMSAKLRDNLFYSLLLASQDDDSDGNSEGGSDGNSDGDNNDDGGGRGEKLPATFEELEAMMKVKSISSRLNLELETLRQINNCEEAYVHMRYFILNTIASESAVSEAIGPKCNPKKFVNFPLYLRYVQYFIIVVVA